MKLIVGKKYRIKDVQFIRKEIRGKVVVFTELYIGTYQSSYIFTDDHGLCYTFASLSSLCNITKTIYEI